MTDLDEGFYEILQFHPAYSYEEFVQGLRPTTRSDGQLQYAVLPGRFMDFCNRAKQSKGRCVLILDEFNRANVSRVFGELMYLLEYRDREIPLAAGGRFQIPSNVRILGTMNTADRSIALVDHALRRRFAFLALHPDFEILRQYHQSTGFDVAPLIELLKRVNRQIGDRHYEVGISFFLKSDLRDQLEDIWRVDCDFDEHSANLKENQILAWTLWRASRTGLCGEQVLQNVRKALRAILSVASLIPMRPNDCVLEMYHRLNEDYRPIHALCRLILDNLGPSHEIGQHQMLPFIVNMSSLFELFVAEWLTANIDAKYTCKSQERVQLGDTGDLDFRIDMVICDSVTMLPLCVLDTKYKIPDKPSQADINQAVTYASIKGCTEAVLVYPSHLARPMNVKIGQIRVRSMTFAIHDDLDFEGRTFLTELEMWKMK